MPDPGGRTGGSALARWTAGVLAAAVLLSIGLPVVGIGVLHASDVLQTLAPWSATAEAGFQPDNPLVTDTVDATTSFRMEYRRRARAGDFPLWSPYAAGGAPLGSIPNASTLSPLTWPWLVVPAWYAPALVKLLEMVVAGGGMFLFLRRLRVGRPAALVAALAMVNTGFQVVWTNWPQSHVGALIPALFWAVERAVQRGRWWDGWPIAVVSAVMWLEGFPAATLWAHVAVGAWALTRVVAHRRRSGAGEGPTRQPSGADRAGSGDGRAPSGDERAGSGRGRLLRGARGPGRLLRGAWGPGRLVRDTVGAVPVAGWLTVGLGIAAVQILPFVQRLNELDVTYRADKLDGALPWSSLATLVVPDAFGSPADRIYFGPVHYVELQSFIGVVALALVAVAAVWGRRLALPRGTRGFLWAALALTAVLTYAGGPLLDALQAVPLVGTNQIGRMRSLVGFLLAVLAGVGFEALLRGAEAGWPRRRVAAAVGVALAGLGVVLVGAVSVAAAAGEAGVLARQALLPAGVAVAALAALAVVLVAGRARVRGAAVAALPLLLAVESVAFAYPFWPRIDTDDFYPVTAAHRFLDAALGHDRFAAAGTAMMPGTAPVYGLRSVTAHTLTTPPYASVLRAVDPQVFERSRTVPTLHATAEVATSPLLDRLGARFFVAPPDAPVLGAAAAVSLPDRTEAVPAGGSVSASVPARPMRAARLTLAEPIDPAVVTRVAVTVRDGDGTVVADGRRRVHPHTSPGPFDVALVPDGGAWPTPSGGAWTVAATVEASAGRLHLGTDPAGALAVTTVAPADDGLEVVFTDGVVVYARTRALPRIRWAAATSGPAGVEELAGLAVDTVMVDGPAAGGGSARLEVVEDSGDAVRVRVDADSAGYVVVADSLGAGWTATVDGEPVPVRDADHALAAVHVGAGTHDVALVYRPVGWRIGFVVTVLALALVAAGAVAGRRSDDHTGQGADTALRYRDATLDARSSSRS